MRKHGDSEAEKLGSVWVSMKYASPKGYLTSNVSTEPTDATNPAHGPHNTALNFSLSLASLVKFYHLGF